MPSQRPSSLSDNSEEGRAFLQSRVALFWRVKFFILLVGSGLGVIGAMVDTGMDVLFSLGETALAAIFWWLCRWGERSIRFSRVVMAAVWWSARLWAPSLGATCWPRSSAIIQW
jgi:hypothetical protein